MRDPKRIDDIVDALLECWDSCPDQRFGQLVENIYRTYGNAGCDMFNVEDDDWLDWIKRFKDDFCNK